VRPWIIFDFLSRNNARLCECAFRECAECEQRQQRDECHHRRVDVKRHTPYEHAHVREYDEDIAREDASIASE
jgi:hypothetical protein